jgi:hypothetical protein
LRLPRTLALGLFVFSCASAARAQSSVYVSGSVFADLQRGSGQTSPIPDRPDTTVAGGGVRVGGFLSPRWSLELGIDAGAATDATMSLIPTDSSITSIGFTSVVTIPTTLATPLPIRPTPIVSLAVDERIRTRVSATSVLLGYHPPSRGRLQAGFKGGISFVRSSNTITSTIAYKVSDPLLLPILQLPAPITDTTSSVAFSTAATVAAELAISLSPHAAIVPEVRAFGFGSRVFLRPGAAVRWFF